MNEDNIKTVYAVVYASVGTAYSQGEEDLYAEALKVFDNFNDAMRYVSKELPNFTEYEGDEDCMEATIKGKWRIETISIQRVEYTNSKNILAEK